MESGGTSGGAGRPPGSRDPPRGRGTSPARTSSCTKPLQASRCCWPVTPPTHRFWGGPTPPPRTRTSPPMQCRWWGGQHPLLGQGPPYGTTAPRMDAPSPHTPSTASTPHLHPK
ncbi:proline-rich receptor-like protein kinase PERK9 [Corvus cornix cornix]|uniref:proline-rich receptor-like protein kinase PERK9 n=1 Tax=Corvus cornix cornix TaxID=932674 RepID=UPI00194DF3DE|nr:proline-rich receptor-like protein kinase PERK9 [Corvus cornix cornix]